MKKLLSILSILLLGNSALHAQGTMTFDATATHPGFTITNAGWASPGIIYPQNPNVNGPHMRITKNSGCFNVTSIRTAPFGYGGGTWEIRTNRGDSYETMIPGVSTVHTLNFNDIQWIEMALIDPGTGGPNNSFDFDDVVYTETVYTPADAPGLSASVNNTCPGTAVTITATGSLNDATNWVFYNGASCTGTPIQNSSSSILNVSPSTTTTYSCKGIDVNGCAVAGACGSITIISGDATAPTAVCQNLTVFLNGAGTASITASDIDNGSSDNCTSVSRSASKTSFNCFNTGANNVTLTVTDGYANSANCNAVVTVRDTTRPAVSCQNLTLFLDGTGNATVTGGDLDNGSTDNCGVSSYSASPSSFTCSDIGANNSTLTVTDAAGNTNSCTSVVTVRDTTRPAVNCQNLTVFLDGAGSATITASDVDNGSTDNCGVSSYSVSQTSFTCSDIGANNTTLTVTDGAGNTNTCTGVVTVSDTTRPAVSCQNLTLFLNGTGNATVTGGDLDGGSTDNCGVSSYSASPSSFTCSDIGANNSTLTVTDAAGNTNSCTSVVTVRDTTRPAVSCQNLTLFLDGTGNATVTGGDLDNGSTDNCGVSSYSVSPSSFTCSDVGANNVTLTVTDGSSNANTCTSVVTVRDTTRAVADCADITVTLDGSGNGSLVAADIDNGSTDNCSVASLSASTTAFTVSDLGTNNVTLTVTDASGNTATCVAVVTVDGPICEVPTAVFVNNITDYSATFNWTGGVLNADRYQMRWRPVGTSQWFARNTFGEVGYRNVKAFDSATEYEWIIRTRCGEGNGDSSQWVSGPNFTTLAGCGPVQDVTVSNILSTQVDASWPDHAGATEYLLRFRPVGGLSWRSKRVDGTTTSVTLRNLLSATQYEYRLRVYCETGLSRRGDLANFTTAGASAKLASAANDSEEGFIVYPNPTSGHITIELGQNAAKATVQIVNALGQLVYMQASNNTDRIDLDLDLKKGVYVLQLITDSDQMFTRLMVE